MKNLTNLNKPNEYIKSRLIEQLVCRHLLSSSAKLTSKSDDCKGVDIFDEDRNIEVKNECNKNDDEYVWFELNKIKDKKIKTTHFLVFFHVSQQMIEWIDIRRDDILKILESGLAENDASKCYEEDSREIKYKDGEPYYDRLCHAKLSWLRDVCPSMFKRCADKKTIDDFMKVQRYVNRRIGDDPKRIDKFIESINSFVENGCGLGELLDFILRS
jgi:hypothetical protein